MVEAIEELFIPVLVYNNKEEDEALLKSFNEPSWNNPVVRFVDEQRRDLIERNEGVWTTQPLAARMVAALGQADREVPDYLKAIARSPERNRRRASFAML